ncbi:hypothetical protein Srot_0073 [Segniliparus rotundus DSM 44985]|uniref:Uncharacterized protein n=1 Tax=Segniliparus rotundus (strain ATCC BAA-972 / CDC 1076 / CIP 108378 / DSM 44985 / JCM 13578) TaxID=640132 RepID=D6Z9N9_SEGRD|nr:hypothetical protein [Segniliparus rotundus]ADG96566.1 hypothetical protein Srot_0073 [Segniliparus rotundus DSM 44985]
MSAAKGRGAKAEKPAPVPGDLDFDWSKVYPEGELFEYESGGVKVVIPVFEKFSADWYRRNRRLSNEERFYLHLERSAKPETFEAADRLSHDGYAAWLTAWGEEMMSQLGK